jgi:hypothetical protein
MGLSTLTVNVGQSGLGRRPINKDKISGILFFNDTLPSGFTSTTRVQKVYSLEEAELLGIVEGSANHDVNWYHISEYFRGNPEGELWIGFFAVPGGAYDFAEISTMIVAAGGEIRQLAVYANALTFASAQVTTIQAIWAALGAAYQQFSILYAANLAATTSITGWAALTDLRTLTARKVTVVISEDGSGAGATLAGTKSYSITNIGLALGMVSLSSVEQSIGNPQNFNISDGTEMEIPALANGDVCGGATRIISDAILAGLKDKGYLICRKYDPDITGTYFERVPTSVAATNDFAWIEYNRAMDKAIRGVRTALIPQLNQTVLVKSDGTLRDDTVGYFQDLAQTPITQMQVDEEVSAGEATVDPTQNVNSTSTLTVAIAIVPVGIAETIVVNIGFTLNT